MTPEQKYEFTERELRKAQQTINAHENRIRILTALLNKYNPSPATDGGISMEMSQDAVDSLAGEITVEFIPDESINDFTNKVKHMRDLYRNSHYTSAECWRDKLAEELDDIMRSK